MGSGSEEVFVYLDDTIRVGEKEMKPDFFNYVNYYSSFSILS